ncbi:hypothetical protein P261_01751 [Lachnospiraceae bacterium TWA4]|nr:hypothetical protein P261_01751 [Lachnospiraceae bacterium TWA4]
MVPLLLAFGLRQLSVNSSSILKVRCLISKWDTNSLEELEQKVLEFDTAEDIENYLQYCLSL